MTERYPSADEIITGLGGNPHTGMCPCPSHDDKKPSLHVGEGHKHVVFHCHAGCSQEAVLDALRARGLWPAKGASLKPVPRRKHSPPDDDDIEWVEHFLPALHILRSALEAKAGKPTAYLRNRGITLMPKNALLLPARDAFVDTGKRFPAMVFPITDGNILLGAHATFLTADAKQNLVGRDGRVRRMYGEAKTGFVQLAEVNPDRPLIVGEGIETTLSAMQFTGLPGIAVLSATNMAAVTLPPCSEVIIAADNDAPGRAATEAAAARWSVPGRVVRVAVAPGAGKDWNDALRADHDPDELREMLLEAPRVKQSRAVYSIGMEAFMRLQFPKRQYLLRPWLTTTGLAMLYADPGVGKTRLAVSIGYAVASGQPLLGWRCEHRAPVLFVDGEMPGELLQTWLADLGPSLPAEDFQILSHSMLEARGEAMPDLGQQDGRDYLDRIIEQNRTELVILDSISTLVRSGVENDVESWRAVQDWSLKHRLRGRAVLFLHHTGRSGKMRGTSLREVVIDTAIRLKGLPEDATDAQTAIELTYPKARHFFGKDTVPLIVRFGTANGRIEWTAEPKSPAHAERVAEMMEDGYTQSAIAKDLGLSKGRVSQIVKTLNDAEAA